MTPDTTGDPSSHTEPVFGRPEHLSPPIQASLQRYWRSNVKIMAALLVLWAGAGLGAGVLFADALNAIRLGGYPLGFWFAQQGSIIVFVVLILVYALALNRLDARHHAEIEALKSQDRANAESSR